MAVSGLAGFRSSSPDDPAPNVGSTRRHETRTLVVEHSCLDVPTSFPCLFFPFRCSRCPRIHVNLRRRRCCCIPGEPFFRQPEIISPVFKTHRLLKGNVGRAKLASKTRATPLHQEGEDESSTSRRKSLMDSSTGTSPGSSTRQRSGRLIRRQN